MKNIILVYQAGIANLFEINRNFGRKLIYQGDFRSAECIAYGMKLAGVKISVRACNQAGDISALYWSTDLENQPFSDKFQYKHLLK